MYTVSFTRMSVAMEFRKKSTIELLKSIILTDIIRKTKIRLYFMDLIRIQVYKLYSNFSIYILAVHVFVPFRIFTEEIDFFIPNRSVSQSIIPFTRRPGQYVDHVNHVRSLLLAGTRSLSRFALSRAYSLRCIGRGRYF